MKRSPKKPATVPAGPTRTPKALRAEAAALVARAAVLFAEADAMEGGGVGCQISDNPVAEWSVPMTKGQAAACLGISVKALGKMEKRGRIAFDEITRQSYRVRLDALDAVTRRAFE